MSFHFGAKLNIFAMSQLHIACRQTPRVFLTHSRVSVSKKTESVYRLSFTVLGLKDAGYVRTELLEPDP